MNEPKPDQECLHLAREDLILLTPVDEKGWEWACLRCNKKIKDQVQLKRICGNCGSNKVENALDPH